jgi:RNA polymerase sigma-70 factor (ECF subfamily)
MDHVPVPSAVSDPRVGWQGPVPETYREKHATCSAKPAIGEEAGIGDPSDETLVTSAIAGDPEAFETLVCRYRPLALKTATTILGPDHAEDAVQDALLLAFRALPTIKNRAKFPRWLSAITRFRALRLRRENQYRTGMVALDDALLATLSNLACAPREEKDGDGLLLAALGSIPPEYAEVIRLHFLHGVPHQEIADFLAVPLSTVKWRCFRGKEMLRDVLRPEGCVPSRLEDARKRKMPEGIVAIWSIAVWSLTGLLPDLLPDLLLDLLPDLLPDLLSLLSL